MARINLLPWRENIRKKRQRDFGFATLFAIILTAAGCAGVYFYIDGMIKHQNKRNNFLKREIAAVDRQIKEIEELERTKAKLIARMNVIQQLQSSRPQVVHLFDELVETIPDGAFLTRLVQSGGNLTLDGRAQSNARVSAYMRNIESSEWIGSPNLQVITNEQKQQDLGLSNFSLQAKQIVKSKENKQ
jgi:type IV pilus assembly protein PilN